MIRSSHQYERSALPLRWPAKGVGDGVRLQVDRACADAHGPAVRTTGAGAAAIDRRGAAVRELLRGRRAMIKGGVRPGYMGDRSVRAHG